MSRATPEASGCRHQATTCSVLPQPPPGQQQTKQQQYHAPTLLAILMVVAVLRYNTAHIAQWRRSRASLEATGRCHWASIAADGSNWSRIHWIFRCFIYSSDPIFNQIWVCLPATMVVKMASIVVCRHP
jgi:hypothetical protein